MNDHAYAAGLALTLFGVAVFFAAYVWAFVLASRTGRRGNWVLGLFFAGILVYPFLARQHWPLMRRNCIALMIGVAAFAAGLVLVMTAHQ